MITLQILEDLAKTYNVVPVTKRLFAGTETLSGCITSSAVPDQIPFF